MLHKLFVLFFVLFFLNSLSLFSQNFRKNLYPDNEIPNNTYCIKTESADTSGIVRIKNVRVPDIAVYLPAKRNATHDAVVICPGGGYAILAYDWEGKEIAKFFNSKGIAAIVLKYRLPDADCQTNKHEVPLKDVQRAMRVTRFYAKQWNIDPDRVGVMGFSAGGHLASSLSVHYDRGDENASDPIDKMSCRPDFSILMYPVISCTEDYQHAGSRKNLVGDDTKLMNYFSNDLHITDDTPPAILFHSSDDKVVPVENTLSYYRGLIKHNVKAELHIYPYGGHGFGLAIGRGYLSTWTDRVVEWMRNLPGNE